MTIVSSTSVRLPAAPAHWASAGGREVAGRRRRRTAEGQGRRRPALLHTRLSRRGDRSDRALALSVPAFAVVGFVVDANHLESAGN